MSDKKTVIALGYFDSVHKGHRKVVKLAKERAEKLGANLVVYTFDGDLKSIIGSSHEGFIYNTSERLCALKEAGADNVFFAPITKEFLSLNKKEFLDLINDEYDIVCYVTGTDYRFGFKAEGTTDYINEYAKQKGQESVFIDLEMLGEEKISTTRIKQALRRGDIELANKMLVRPYSISGEVYRDRQVGATIGFPTVNVKIENGKFAIKEGVYKGSIDILGEQYKTVINYGARPTFDNANRCVEAHIIGYDGNLYDKKITLFFDKFIREIKKFEDKNALVEQLKADVKCVKDGKYD